MPQACAAPLPDPRPVGGVAAAVDALLSRPERELDYAEAKLELDRLADPGPDIGSARDELDRLTETARRLAGPQGEEPARLGALRTLLYRPGPWNGHRPFAYDHGDPDGQSLTSRLLPHYLVTRRGNCVSMPILFLILAERLRLDVALATAPDHIFVRYTPRGGPVLNLETTSGAGPTRDVWIRQNMPMSERALANGLYLRSLSRREAVAAMASSLVEHLLHRQRYEESATVCALILRHAPLDVHAMLKQATAYGHLVEREFTRRYAAPFLIPPPLRPRYLFLLGRNLALFARAEALGWQAPSDA